MGGKSKEQIDEQIFDCVHAFQQKEISDKLARARLRELGVEDPDIYLYGDNDEE